MIRTILIAIFLMISIHSSSTASDTAALAQGPVNAESMGRGTDESQTLVRTQDLYFDASGDEELDTVKKKQFVPGKNFLNFEQIQSSIWFKFKLNNKKDMPLNLTFGASNLDSVDIYTSQDDEGKSFKKKSLTIKEIQSYYNWITVHENQIVYLRVKNAPILNAYPYILTNSELIVWMEKKSIAITIVMLLNTILFITTIIFIFVNPKNIFNLFVLSFTFFRIVTIVFLTIPQLFNFIDHQTSKKIFILIFLIDRATLYLFIAIIFKNKFSFNYTNKNLAFIYLIIILAGAALLTAGSNIVLKFVFLNMCIFCIYLTINFIKEAFKIKRLADERTYYLSFVAYLIFIQFLIIYELTGIYKFPIIENDFSSTVIAINGSAIFVILVFFTVENLKEIFVKNTQIFKISENLKKEEINRKNQQGFISMLLHELNTPLSIIKLGIQTVSRRGSFNPEERARLNRIDLALNDVNQIIESCVLVDKYTDSDVSIKFESISAQEFIEDLFEEFQERYPALLQRTKIIFNTPYGPHPKIYTDPQYLRITFSNLIKNAINYSPAQSQIDITINRIQQGGHSKIQFNISNDLNPGETLNTNNLFQRYYRSENAKRNPGTGLGLWLSQTLMKQLNSPIEVFIQGGKILFSLSFTESTALTTSL